MVCRKLHLTIPMSHHQKYMKNWTVKKVNLFSDNVVRVWYSIFPVPLSERKFKTEYLLYIRCDVIWHKFYANQCYLALLRALSWKKKTNKQKHTDKVRLFPSVNTYFALDLKTALICDILLLKKKIHAKHEKLTILFADELYWFQKKIL